MPVKKKTTTPAPLREWDEIRADVERMAGMSCKPTKQKLRPDTILDEDQTVRWNREQVEKHNVEVEQEVKDLNTKKNKWRDQLYEEIYTKIVVELGGRVDTKGAARIFAYAYEQGHAYGVHDVFCHLMELLELFVNVLEVS